MSDLCLCLQLDMECALLDGEQKSETTELMKEKEILDHLNRKIGSSKPENHRTGKEHCW